MLRRARQAEPGRAGSHQLAARRRDRTARRESPWIPDERDQRAVEGQRCRHFGKPDAASRSGRPGTSRCALPEPAPRGPFRLERPPAGDGSAQEDRCECRGPPARRGAGGPTPVLSQAPRSPWLRLAPAERWRAAISSRTIPRARMTASHARCRHLAVVRRALDARRNIRSSVRRKRRGVRQRLALGKRANREPQVLPTEGFGARGGLEGLARGSGVSRQLGAAAQRDGNVRMLGTQPLLLNRQCTGEQRPGVIVVAGSQVEARKIHQTPSPPSGGPHRATSPRCSAARS